MTTRADAVAVMRSFLGISESPPHSNRTPIGVEFGWNGVPWCAETCSVCWNRAFGRKILWTAAVAIAISDAKAGKNGMRLLPRNAQIQAGMLVTYDFGGRGNSNDFHIAMVIDPGDQLRFRTIGGNEADAVREQWRDRTYVTHFIDGPYTDAANPSPQLPSQEEDDEMAVYSQVLLPYGGGGQCTIDFDDLKTGAAGWRHGIIRIPWDYPGGPRSHRIRGVAWNYNGDVGTLNKLPEFFDLQAAKGPVVIPISPDWAGVSLTSQVKGERDIRGDTYVTIVLWK